MQDDFKPISPAEAFRRLRVMYRHRHTADQPKFSTAKATIKILRDYAQSGDIPLRGELNGSHAVDIPQKDYARGKLRISAKTLTCAGTNDAYIYRNVHFSKAAVDRLIPPIKKREAWKDISYALDVIQELGVSIGLASVGASQSFLREECGLERVRSRRPFPFINSRWWVTEQVPLQEWQKGMIDERSRLIPADGSEHQKEEWRGKVTVNINDLRYRLDTLIKENAAEPGPVELPAPAPPPAPVIPPTPIKTDDGEQPKKQQTSRQPKPSPQPLAAQNRDGKRESRHQAEHFPQPSRRRGPKTGKTEAVVAKMQTAIGNGSLTHAQLASMTEEAMAADYKVSRDTARTARNKVLSPPSD